LRSVDQDGREDMRKMKTNSFFVLWVTLVLLIVNLAVYGLLGDQISRVVRFLSMFVFFLISFSEKYFKKSAVVILGAFVVNDLLLIFFESPLTQHLVLLIRLAAYALLAALVLPYLKRIKVQLFEGILFASILIVNFFMLYYIQDSISAFNKSGWLDNFLFYGYGTALYLSVSTAFTFYSRYVDKASIFFLLALIGLVLSDLTFFIGFYLDFPEFYYLDRGFNIIAIGLLLHFFFLFKRKVARNFYAVVEDKI
jgi:hypothetical protein